MNACDRRLFPTSSLSKTKKISRVLLLAFGLCLAPARGAVVLDNLNAPDWAALGIIDSQAYAQRFTTGDSAQGYFVNSISVRLGSTANLPLAMALFEEEGSHPAESPLHFLNPLSDPEGDDVRTFGPTSPITLEANTSYWVAWFNPLGAGTAWSILVTDSTAYQSIDEWTLGVDGQNYASRSAGNPNWTLSSLNMRTPIRIDATPIPEPVSALLLAGAIGALMLRRNLCLRPAAPARSRSTIAHRKTSPDTPTLRP